MTKDVPELKAHEANEDHLIQFLHEKMDKMVFFLDDMANATYISEQTKHTFNEIKEYVNMIAADRAHLKATNGDPKQILYLGEKAKLLQFKIDQIEYNWNYCECAGPDCPCA